MAVHEVNGIPTHVKLEDVLIKKPFRMQIIGASGRQGDTQQLADTVAFKSLADLAI